MSLSGKEMSVARFVVWMVLVSSMVAWVGAGDVAGTDHPLKSDPTGINWAFTFQDAKRIAQDQNKIMMLKPVSARSQSDNDQLSPSAEAWRAGVLVDSRVVNLINRRFVPYYFDMDSLGSEYSKEAVFVAQNACPELRFEAALPTPPVLFLTPEGKLLHQLGNHATADEYLAAMTAVLKENPEYGLLTEQEAAVQDPMEKAWIHYELRQFDEALASIKSDQSSSEAYYLRGVIARERGDWTETRRSFRMVTDVARKRDIMIEEAHRYWAMRNFRSMLTVLDGLTAEHPRYMEGMYLLGLAHYHLEETTRAFEVWERAIKHDPQHSWALRLDWTCGLARLGREQMVLPHERPPSLLGRNYLTPNGNPDLILD